MWRLQGALSEIAGLPHVSLQPSPGSHGELAGLLLTRAYHEDRGESRHKVLTPDTAHGTNPATVTMAGYEVVKVGTDEHGGVDVDDLRAKADDDVACLMLTNPNTLGLFDRNIEEIASIVHGVGGTLYYDGANLNAVMGISRPGRHGLRHRPLQPAQDLHPAARRRRTGRRADRVLGSHRAVPAGAPGGSQHARERGRAALHARPRQAEVDRQDARFPGQLRRVRALVRLHLLAGRRRAARGVGDRGAERQLPAGATGARRTSPSTCRSPSTASACTSSCSREGRARPARHQDAGHREADARPRGPSAHGLLPAAGGRGADDRAHRDRAQGAPRPLHRGGAVDPRRRPRRTRRSRRTRPTTRRCGVWTRRARRSGRWCAGARTPRTRGDPDSAAENPASATGAV